MATIRCLAMDVDGVLTDGRLWYGAQPEPLRAFHIHDGLAIRWFARLGGIPVIVTGKRSEGVAHRARELGIEYVIQGSDDKRGDLERLLERLGVTAAQTCMIGDDLPDIPPMRAVGYPIAVANAVAEVKAAACWTTTRSGGQGAVREAIEHLLRADNRWQEVLAAFEPIPSGT